jgi:threonylcarbamoyladenosine tRNA methylthiotransferase MtaB
VERVLGNHEKLDAQFYRRSDDQAIQQAEVWVRDIMTLKESANHLVPVMDGRARAFLEIQNGCNHRCTFCVIPFGRGPNRSVPLGTIVEQARLMVESAYAEIVLTGVDMTGYGQDLPGTPSLGETVQRLLTLVPGLGRLRLSSLDVAEIDPVLFRLLAEEPRIMPHVHLSLQAGSAMILKRMKRRHTPEDAERFCRDLRAARPDVVFGADIIAGFPTETEEMFKDSLRMVEALDLTLLHVFPFSPREGTPAARMPQLPKAVRKERAQALRHLGRDRLADYLRRGVGRQEEILAESPHKGRTNHYIPVALEAPLEPGRVHRVTITGINAEATEWIGAARACNDWQGGSQ